MLLGIYLMLKGHFFAIRDNLKVVVEDSVTADKQMKEMMENLVYARTIPLLKYLLQNNIYGTVIESRIPDKMMKMNRGTYDQSARQDQKYLL